MKFVRDIIHATLVILKLYENCKQQLHGNEVLEH